MKKTSHKPISDYPIIVHCHLCWDWVWQRPQQFLSRLSKRHRILFVETHAPTTDISKPEAVIKKTKYPNLTLLQIRFPLARWNDGVYVDLNRRRLVQEAISGPLAGQFEKPVQWFYDPMAVTAFANQMDERAIVYDCMDELSQFRNAPKEMIKRERELLWLADVVFTGGRKLYESKRRYNQNCHFYGCGVDVRHFSKATEPSTKIPEELASLPKPVLGYFGVVDERMDYDLVRKMAEAHPEWSIVILGPAIKVDPTSFPRLPNIHWMGGQDYQNLPAFTKGFDVCLMPFALNESTEYINPTKALEYMATATPIVSTAVPDVVSNFGQVVKIGQSHEEFIELCQKEVANPDREAIKRGLAMAEDNTWEKIVLKLEQHIDEHLADQPERKDVTRPQETSENRITVATP